MQLTAGNLGGSLVYDAELLEPHGRHRPAGGPAPTRWPGPAWSSATTCSATCTGWA